MAIIIFFASLALACLGYVQSRGLYDEYIEVLDSKEFKIKQYLPIGLYMNEKVHIFERLPPVIRKPAGKYIYKHHGMLAELYGYRYAKYYAVIFSAQKTVYALIGLLVPSMIGCVLLLTGDSENALFMALGSIVLGVLLPLSVDQEVKKRVEGKRASISLEFPDFMNKITLLVNAGMTISKAWEKIVMDNKKDSPLQRELMATQYEIMGGKPEAVAYADFAQRCKVKEIVKCVSVIVSNLRKGGEEVVPTLRLQAEECWQMRKANARMLGEQAGTKLLMPLMIMLIGIIVIVVTPAVLMLGGSM